MVRVNGMVGLLPQRCSPIGVDIGSRVVKLVQLTADGRRVWETSAAEFPRRDREKEAASDDAIADAIERAKRGRRFRGRQAVFCLSARDLFVQNIRVPCQSEAELLRTVYAEAETRLPVPVQDAEIRFFEAGQVRQGDALRSELILMACRKRAVEKLMDIADSCGMRLIGADAEPAALVRCYARQFRREDDRQRTMMFVNIGASNTVVAIARHDSPIFIKYVPIGGRNFDEAVAQSLGMSIESVVSLRRHNGDRRSENRDPEIVRNIEEAVREPLDRLTAELSMCLRYHSVTFRGQTVDRVVIGGGEASERLVAKIGSVLGVPTELGNPFRSIECHTYIGKPTVWDVAAGLALRSAAN